MSAFWTGVKRSCINVTRETSPRLLVDLRARPNCAASGVAAFRSGVLESELTDSNGGQGPFVGHAVATRPVASTAIAFFGVRRASEVA